MTDVAPVVIVGAGPVGLTVALDLARRGTRSVLVEREAGTALELLAKAGTLNERTMEYCRWLGIRDAIIDVGFPDDHPRDVVYCTSLNGFLLGRDPLPSTKQRTPPSETPEMLRKCPQHLFDPLLADAVSRAGFTDVRYATEFVSYVERDDGVDVSIRPAGGGAAAVIRAQYLVGCDGAASTVRGAAGIPFEGEQLDYSVSAMIRVKDLETYHPMGRGERYMFVGTEGTWANLTAVDGRELYRLTMVGSEQKLAPEKLDINAVLCRAMGRDDIPVEVVRVLPWRRSQFAAATFTCGRVLLAGDSAHTTSPTGGHGLNTGIGDVSDLGWMLDARLRGWGGAGLLGAYSAERRPVAIRNSANSTRNYKVWIESPGRDLILEDSPQGAAQRRAVGSYMSTMLRQEWHSLGVGMGYRYDTSPLVVPDGTAPTPDDASEYVQTARPGHRAPHVRLADGRSTLDLFGDGFVLLDLSIGGARSDALVDAAASVGLPLLVVALDEPAVAEAYGRAMVLVRPDGMVAWRGDVIPADAGALVDTVRGANT